MSSKKEVLRKNYWELVNAIYSPTLFAEQFFREGLISSAARNAITKYGKVRLRVDRAIDIVQELWKVVALNPWKLHGVIRVLGSHDITRTKRLSEKMAAQAGIEDSEEDVGSDGKGIGARFKEFISSLWSWTGAAAKRGSSIGKHGLNVGCYALLTLIIMMISCLAFYQICKPNPLVQHLSWPKEPIQVDDQGMDSGFGPGVAGNGKNISEFVPIDLMEFRKIAYDEPGSEEPKSNYTLHFILTETEPNMEWMAKSFVMVGLPPNLQDLEKISAYPWIDEHHQILEFEEKEANEEQSVKVQIATATDGEAENWEVIHQTPNEMFRKHVDIYRMGVEKTLPCYKARIVWKGNQERSATFHRRVDFLGAKPPNTYHIYVSHSASKPSGCTSSEELTSTESSRKGKSSDFDQGPPQADSDLVSPFREFCHSIALIGYYKDHDPLLAGLIAIAVISTAAVFMFITGMIAWRCSFK